MIKVDIADGFYCLHLSPHQIPSLGVAFPPVPDSMPLLAFPLVLPMGWVESPPAFYVATETIADTANSNLRQAVPSAPHRLRNIAKTPPAPGDTPVIPTPLIPLHQPTSLPMHPLGPRKKPVKYVDLYMDNFLIGLLQGGQKRRDHVT
jgi:hypothetical protein